MWSKLQALFTDQFTAKVLVEPAWYLAWGRPSQLGENVTWRDDQLAIAYAQPAFSCQQQFVVVGEVWLSNRAQLLRCLGIDSTLHQGSDSQIVAQLWERWGVESLSLLEGMFALTVWDRARQELWLVRDRVGSFTLYYTTIGSTRWIAPRLRSLAPYRSGELDLVALRDYLCCAFVPGEQTLWRQVRELRPGTCLRLPDEQVQYWQPQEEIRNAEQPLAWHGLQLRSLLEQVVQEYLPTNEPVGVFLSGGIDSSCITALAAKLHNYPVHTYSIHFGLQYPNELNFSNLVAEHCQTQHHILEITPDTLWEKLPLAIAHLDDPIGEGLTVPNLLVGQLAKESVNVVLNGEGGDPCFGGPKNQPLLLNSLYSSVVNQNRDGLLSAYLTSFKKCFLDLPRLLQPDVWASVQAEPSVFEADLTSSDITYLNRLMLLNIKFKGADYILTKVNNFTHAASLQGRSPLFDQRVVQLSMQIPPEYKLFGAEEKAVLKQAVADLLPEVILKRPKSGMMMHMHQWFRTVWRQKARSLLLNKKAAIAPYFNQILIRQWLDYQGQVWPRYGVLIWLLVSLEIWLQVNQKE